MNPRDAAIAELCKLLPDADPGDVAAALDRIVTAAAVEAGHRVAEGLVEPLSVATRKHADAVSALLGRAHRELVGGDGG
jgi:hypothetical protein